MKILHCCLAAFYIDDFSYQENILPRIHKGLGHEVEILASTETYIDKVKLGYTNAGSYTTKEGIPLTRLPYVSWLPSVLARKLRLYRGIDAVLDRFAPDVVFLHDCQFLSIQRISHYAQQTGATVYVDSHTDFINSGRSFVSRNILHRVIYRMCSKVIEPYVKKYFPTLPLRAEFLINVYDVPRRKIELLPFGVDDNRIRQSHRAELHDAIREELKIPKEAFVFIAGGKIDKRKAIHLLVDRFSRLADSDALNGAYFILFGQPTDDLRDQVALAAKNTFVRYVGWVDANDIHKYLWASDVAIFPGTHSVLWEEALGLGIPCVFRRWKGIEHVDLGGNCLFLDEVTPLTVDELLIELASDQHKVAMMKEVAQEKGRKFFSYTEIARRAIEEQ